jgi:predicted ArsR family transcriptional regulator
MPRPSYQPTEDQQRLARAMAAVGARQEDIAAELGITAKTLRKHFRQELRQGVTHANVKVGQTLFAMATSGRNVAASIYWDRTRGFARKRPSETGGQPMPPPQIIIRAEGQENQSAEGVPEQ